MAPHSARAEARAALVIADPKAARQFGAHGAVVLWRELAGGGRHGLLCVPDACDNPHCESIHLWLLELDERVISVARNKRGAVALSSRPGAPDRPARPPAPEAYASYQPSTGEVSASDKHQGSPLFAWLKASADADVLAHLRVPLNERELAAGR